ncbi:MAG TPA: hypothetical protein VKR52_19825 [Terracidiphilus sp.]|nr:hypothetical protein [Terracidiphilus sp.]
MSIDRRTILSLIALGRITPREAERLLALGPDPDEGLVKLGIVLAVVLLALPQVHEIAIGLGHALQWIVPQLNASAHHALGLITRLLGGNV